MKKRQKLLMNELINVSSKSILDLAEIFKVSNRTIRNDIEVINEVLNESNIKPISIKNNIVHFDLYNKDDLISYLIEIENDFYKYKLSTMERVALIISTIIKSEEYITIETLSNELSVSRTTINTDIIIVKEWFLNHKANLVSKKGKGLIVEESEKIKRTLITSLIKEFQNLTSEQGKEVGKLSLYTKLFKNVDIESIKRIIMLAEKKFNLELSDSSYEELIIHIALLIERYVYQKQAIDNTAIHIKEDKKEYKVAEFIINYIEKENNILIAKDEIIYIAIHIYGKSQNRSLIENDDYLYIQYITQDLIENISKTIMCNIRNDYRLNQDLTNHLTGTIFRARHNINIINPIKDDVISEYREIYEAIIKNCKRIEWFLDEKLNDDEVSYILIHIAAAVERCRTTNKSIKPTVIIVCGSGIGTSRLLISRLEKFFNFNILKTMSFHNLDQIKGDEKFDFIISTIDIKSTLPWIKVNPLFKDDDIYKINNILINLGFSYDNFHGAKIQTESAKEIYNILKNYGDDEEQLIKEVKKFLINKEKVVEKGGVLMLSEILKEENIDLNCICSDWKEAIYCAGKPLLEVGAIEEEYIKSSIKNVEESGPYIVITKGAAIPHSNSKNSVNKTAISLARLKTPINFKESENNPVKYVFMIATIDATSHIHALSDLVNFLEDRTFFKCIDEAQQPSEIMDYIVENETKI